MVELVDTPDLKSCSLQGEYGFDSRPGYELRCYNFSISKDKKLIVMMGFFVDL